MAGRQAGRGVQGIQRGREESQSKSDFIDVIVVFTLTVEQIEYELNEN